MQSRAAWQCCEIDARCRDVLAKIAGAPDNVKGISLFVVPKFLVNADGSLGARNAVSCGALEKKMGIHGNATCVMNYDGAKGWLIGEPEKGLAAMFIMMNAARLGVGLQGLAQGEVAYQNAAAYAKDRRQGKALDPALRDPDARADPIIVHPDVRRMLMEMKSFLEGARALVHRRCRQVLGLDRFAPCAAQIGERHPELTLESACDSGAHRAPARHASS